MRIARHWRLNSQRYAMQGVTCPQCSSNIFPPRDVCPYCEAKTEAAYELKTVEAQREEKPAVDVLERAAAR
jgi:uncharacterized OB-fold protein